MRITRKRASDALLSHPEWLCDFAVDVTTRDANVAQSLVAEELQFVSRTCSLSPPGELAFDLVPTQSAMHSKTGEDHAHGWLRNPANFHAADYAHGSRRRM
jgi:hypothetical protein